MRVSRRRASVALIGPAETDMKLVTLQLLLKTALPHWSLYAELDHTAYSPLFLNITVFKQIYIPAHLLANKTQSPVCGKKSKAIQKVKAVWALNAGL